MPQLHELYLHKVANTSMLFFRGFWNIFWGFVENKGEHRGMNDSQALSRRHRNCCALSRSAPPCVWRSGMQRPHTNFIALVAHLPRTLHKITPPLDRLLQLDYRTTPRPKNSCVVEANGNRRQNARHFLEASKAHRRGDADGPSFY